MNISSPFIRRPIGTSLLTAAIVLAGIVAYLQLPVAPLPQVDFPTINVQASLPGASPAIMASSVATPLERQFGHIAGLTEMTSSSTLGSTSITLQFDLSRNIDGAARDVQAAINAARAYLPSNLPTNPSWRKSNPANAPIMIIALTSDIYDRGQMYDSADSIIEQRLLQIDGVGQINVGGGALPSVRVDVNPTLLNSFGLSLEDVRTMLNAQNANLAKGQIANDNQTADILDNDQLFKASDYKPLVVTYKNGAPVRLSDIANVQDSIENVRVAGYVNGKEAVPLIIFSAPGANIIQTVDRIKAALPSLKASIPAGMDMTVMMDRSTTIRSSVHVVEGTLCVAIILVILVVFVFLRNPRTILIPAVVVPTSLIGTFAVMYLFGYSLDNLSLMALTISTGFVVDDAIVVVENVSRHAELGLSPREAALKGAREVGFTVLSISISLVAVFTPILLMGGLVGRLFREFAVTLSTAILVSLVISLTTTPMLCSLLLRYRKEEEHNWFYRTSEQGFTWLHERYKQSLQVVLRHPAVTLVTLLLTIVATVFLAIIVPKGFFPEQDNGTVFGGIVGDEDASYHAMQKVTERFNKIATNDPAVAGAITFTGGGNGAANSGFVYVALKPLNERKISALQVVNRLRPKFAVVPGATVFPQPGQDLRIGGRQSNAQYQYTIQSEDLNDLNKWGPTVLQHMQKMPGFTDVNSDQQNDGLQASLIYDRNTAARLGISTSLIDSTIYDAFGQEDVSTMDTPLNQYYVIMEVEPQFWQDPQGLNEIYLHATNSSGMVPLSAIAHYVPTTAPIQVNHTGQFPSVTISFNLRPGFALGDAVREIDQMEQNLKIPASITGSFSGTAAAFQSALSNELWLVLTALGAVYIVLGILYESYIHPITIISTLPSAGVGALLALLLFNTDFSIIAFIGLLLLIGIVKKNAILMVDFAISAEREQNIPPHEAIYQACVLRFRPILMTTMAAMFGALPLVISNGIGSELRKPLGIAIVGGLMLSQVLTLYTTPVVYLYFDRLRLWWESLRHRQARPATFPPPVPPSAFGLSKRGRPMKTMHFGKILVVVVLAALWAGCNFAPKYSRPAVEIPATFKEDTGTNNTDTNIWQAAHPDDAVIRSNWWETFNDSQLNALEQQVAISNQNVVAAFENFLSAHATVRETQAEYFPTVNLNPSASRSRTYTGGGLTLRNPNVDNFDMPLDASWELDLWGRIRNSVKAAAGQAQASAADLENTKLAAQAELASDYFQLQGQDSLIKLYDDTVNDYSNSLQLTDVLFKTGIDSDQDVAQAQTQLETTESQASNLRIERATLEHAIAVLVGQPPSDFSIAPMPLNASPPFIPVAVPSQLLERRPDVAAAERAVFSANAEIGVARSAFFPAVTLSASGAFESTSLGFALFHWSNRVWSLGAAASQPIFNAGLPPALVQYRAEYDSAVAQYRQTVLTAFQGVEDNLATLRVLKVQIQQQQVAVNSSQKYLDLAVYRYKLGIDSYLEVITAQTTLLSNRQTLVNLYTQQMQDGVTLIEDLGGGWDAKDLPKD